MKTLLNYMKSLFAKTNFFYDAIMLLLCFIVLFVFLFFFTSSKQPNCRLINLFIQYAVLRLIGMHNEKNIENCKKNR